MAKKGYYDISIGMRGYSPILGSLGALVVPAIIFIFTGLQRPSVLASATRYEHSISLAVGLLIVAMIGCLVAAMGFAALGAEKVITPNVPAGVIFFGLPASISIVNILGSFAVLAAIYMPGSSDIFLVTVGAGGLVSVLYSSFGIIDSWQDGPDWSGIEASPPWWNGSTKNALNWATWTASVSGSLVLVGTIVRLTVKPYLTNGLYVNSTLIAGLLLVLFGTIYGYFRVLHPTDDNKDEHPLRATEAFGVMLLLTFYILLVVLFLP